MFQEIHVRVGVKKRPHPSGGWGVWIFSGISHFMTLLLFTYLGNSGNELKLVKAIPLGWPSLIRKCT